MKTCNTINGKTPDEIKKDIDEALEEASWAIGGGDAHDLIDALEKTYASMASALAYIRQLERERDAAVGSLKRYAACLDCTHYRQEAFGYQQSICQGCKFGSNWQWRGAEVE